MITVTFQGFKSIAHAEEFIDWYEGQGEQDSRDWLETNDQPSAYVDMSSPTKLIGNSFFVKIK